MRHRSRRLSIAAMLSCFLGLLMAAAWIRSYWVGDFVGWRTSDDSIGWSRDVRRSNGLFSQRGELAIGSKYSSSPANEPPHHHVEPSWQPTRFIESLAFNPPGSRRNDQSHWILPPALYFARDFVSYDSGSAGECGLVVHYWLLVLLLCLPMLFPLWRDVRSLTAGRQHGQCTACGYDLRATPARCPECGRNAGVDA